MKKFIVLSLFVALFLNTKAQTSFGLKGGFNLASVKIAVAEAGISVSTKSKTSFVIGGYLNHPLTESLSIQPELLLQGMGFKFEGETLNSNYISLPVVFKYAITKAVNLEAGPQIAFLMSAKVMGEDVKDAFKSTDFQLVFGIGAHGISDLPLIQFSLQAHTEALLVNENRFAVRADRFFVAFQGSVTLNARTGHLHAKADGDSITG
jgi:hypothetical protein